MLFEYATGIPVIRISSEKDRFDITKDKILHCFFNRNAVMTAKTSDDSFWPITGLLVRSIIRRPDMKVIIRAEKSFADFVKSIVDTINKSKQEKIQVLEEKPDEMTENTPAEYPVCAENISTYREQLKKFSETFEDAVESSAILLRTSFPKTMWGAKDLKSCLSKMKTGSIEVSKSKEIFEGAAEQSDIRLSHLISCLFDSSMSIQKYAEDSVNHVITNFLTMKRMMASFLQSFHRLYTSDQLFKKYSGYPATWFFDSSVFYNFMERYEDVSDNLIEASRAESSVIRPLYALKSK